MTLVHRTTTIGTSNVLAHAGQSSSAAALVAAYGLAGLKASCSLNSRNSGAGPNTSSVDMHITLRIGRFRAHSSRLNVPTTLSCRYSAGETTERSTWLAAAR